MAGRLLMLLQAPDWERAGHPTPGTLAAQPMPHRMCDYDTHTVEACTTSSIFANVRSWHTANRPCLGLPTLRLLQALP